MNLLQVVKHLQGIALTIPNIRSANEGSVYTIQNGNPHQKYMSFVVSQTTHRTDDLFDYFGLNLFLIDRLTDELEANRLQIQSLAKDCLTNILIKFCNKFYGATYNELVFHPFTEKFTDLCAGQYVQVTLQIPRNIICEDEYTTEYLPEYVLEPLVVEITENGIFEYEPEDIDGYNKVTVTVNVDIPDNFESGFTSGVTYQKSLLSAITITENGEYITDENGVSAITVDVSGYTQDDLDDAYQSGITYQKSLLSAITIDHNGEFINENGYSAITVNVPQTGESVNNQSKIVEISGNGSYTITYDEGYTGLEVVIINVNVSGDTPTPPTPSGDTSAYTDMYLTIEALNDGNIIWKASSTSLTRTIQYSKDDGVNWTSVTSTTGGTEIPVSAGDVVLFKGSNGYYGTDLYANSFGYTTSICKVYGNIMSLIYGDNFTDKTTLGNNYTFISLFAQFEHNFDNGYLVDVSNLILPATGLTQGCYQNMFYDCTMITTAPALPATVLADECYMQMFRHCSRLISAPELPATTLAYMCYDTMFTECYKLTKAPVLPATTLIEKCYMSMFYQCYHLNEVKCLATDLSASNCTNGWLVSVSSTGTFTKAQGVTWPTGSSGIPNNWTVIEK